MTEGTIDSFADAMRPGLTAKLFLAMLAVALFAVLAMGVASRRSFNEGFLGYLTEQETSQLFSINLDGSGQFQVTVTDERDYGPSVAPR